MFSGQRLAVAVVGAITLASSAVYAKGNIERGRAIAIECFACHGKDGNAPSPVNPKIGGQHEKYLLVALKEYKNGQRKESLMRGAVLKMVDQEIEDVAAYYASQKAFTEVAGKPSAPGAKPTGPGGPGGPEPSAYRSPFPADE